MGKSEAVLHAMGFARIAAEWLAFLQREMLWGNDDPIFLVQWQEEFSFILPQRSSLRRGESRSDACSFSSACPSRVHTRS
jgi:hypothetical protein